MSTPRPRLQLFDDHSAYVDRFGLLLTVSVVAVITLSLVNVGGTFGDVSAEAGSALVTLFVGVMVLLALRAAGVARRWRAVGDVIVAVSLVAILLLLVIDIFSDTETEGTVSATPSPIWVLLTTIAPILVIRRIAKHRRVTVATLLGAVAAYLLIAVAFTFAYLTVDAYQDGSFFGTEEPSSGFMYYSLVTITTLGYGDLSTTSEIGRLFSTAEAVVGQVYLVTFVAMIVGLLAQARQTKP